MKLIATKPSSPLIVALGANLPFGDLAPPAVLHAAMGAMESAGIKISLKSRIFRTGCFPAGAGPDYANAVVVARDEFKRNPAELLQILHSVEAAFGRERLERWGGRTLDLDLIAAGDSVLPDSPTWHAWHDLPVEAQMREAPAELILPHPRLQDRAFVLVPLAELLPDWKHPVLGLTILEMLQALSAEDRAGVATWPGC